MSDPALSLSSFELAANFRSPLFSLKSNDGRAELFTVVECQILFLSELER